MFINMNRCLTRLRKLFCTVRHKNIRQHVDKCESDEEIKRFIIANTELVKGNSLTPEICLRLFTPQCRFWTERPELWPFPEPFWAVYWPGGQALARYLLNNPDVSVGRKVLDLGCGCGASAIAAKLRGAAHVVASDIDPVAAIATQLNCELNGIEPFLCVTENLISSQPENWDLILLGDMFYDETLANDLHKWLQTCIKNYRTNILIGDPGRTQINGIKTMLLELATFELPDSVKQENYGLTNSTVWCYRLD